MAPLAGVAQRGAGWPWAHIHVAVGVGSFEEVRVLRDESCGGVSHLGLRNLRPSNGHESQGKPCAVDTQRAHLAGGLRDERGEVVHEESLIGGW